MLDDKIAVVTGGASGIGAAISRLFARSGAHVVVTSEQPLSALEGFCSEIAAAGGSASAIACDVSDREAITRLVGEVDRRHGRLDILVNCAGLFYRAPLEAMDDAKIEAMFAINALGPIRLVQAALPIMRRGGGGAIVNIASGAAVLGVEGCAVYAATKVALSHFTRTLAPELRRSGIRINAVAPGSVRTPMLGFKSDELTPEQVQSLAKREAGTMSPYGNPMIDPVDIAEVVLFLVSDAARALQGSLVLADQGISSAMPAPG
jgi:NAD(P)-dependent dehydrogenase (short-subunit alcohol dehydrogenase family)